MREIKRLRDAAIASLACSASMTTLQRLNVSDVTDGVVVCGRRMLTMTTAQHEAVYRWLSIRPQVALADEPALFVNLHWTEARRKPGTRLSYGSLRRSVMEALA